MHSTLDPNAEAQGSRFCIVFPRIQRDKAMSEETLFRSEHPATRAEVAQYLRALADKLDADGTVQLSTGTDTLELTLPEHFEFEVKAERETSQSGNPPEMSLELEFEWREGVDHPKGAGRLEIG